MYRGNVRIPAYESQDAKFSLEWAGYAEAAFFELHEYCKCRRSGQPKT